MSEEEVSGGEDAINRLVNDAMEEEHATAAARAAAAMRDSNESPEAE